MKKTRFYQKSSVFSNGILVVALVICLIGCDAVSPCFSKLFAASDPSQTSVPTATPEKNTVYGDSWLSYSSNGGAGGYQDHIAFVIDYQDEKEIQEALKAHQYTILDPEEIDVRKEGYQFQCWNTKADGTGTLYAPGQQLSSAEFTALLEESLTLYAIWGKSGLSMLQWGVILVIAALFIVLLGFMLRRLTQRAAEQRAEQETQRRIELLNDLLSKYHATLLSFQYDAKAFGDMMAVIEQNGKPHTFIADRGEMCMDNKTIFNSSYHIPGKDDTWDKFLEMIITAMQA